MLDIIVTHYKEPWEVGAKFFSMLDLQRGVDFSQFQVILVNDGEENKLPDEHFSNRPYPVKQISIPHGGVSAARNAGLKAATDEWVMFCDFDDMFVHVYGIKDILNVLPTDFYDIAWTDLIIENKKLDNELVPTINGENYTFIHGKIFRRKYLLEKKLFFQVDLPYSEDGCFLHIAEAVTPRERIGHIKTKMPTYVWTFTENSTTTTIGYHYEWPKYNFEANKRICDVYKENLSYKRYCAMVYRTVGDIYNALNITPFPRELNKLKQDFHEFWKTHRQAFFDTGAEDAKQIDEFLAHMRDLDRNREVYFGKEYAVKHADIPIGEWVMKMESEAAT